jgi:hypothetical protein
MVLTEDDEIKSIKEEAELSNDPLIIIKAIDALAGYGERVIADILEILDYNPHNSDVKKHGLEVIERLKKLSIK